MNTEQKPSVGRIVHYKAPELHAPLAALVTEVHTDGTIAVRVFTGNGDFVRTLVSESPKPKDDHWTWPPRV